jgi:hypothetical protein
MYAELLDCPENGSKRKQAERESQTKQESQHTGHLCGKQTSDFGLASKS